MDPERPIEKLLRDYAKERREQAGTPELHPATRRLLQSEVARQYPAQPPPRRPLMERLFDWRSAWAWGFSALAAVVLVALLAPSLARTKPKGMYLAKNEPADATELNPQARQAGRPAQERLNAPAVQAVPAAAPTQPPAEAGAVRYRAEASVASAAPAPARTLAPEGANRRPTDAKTLSPEHAAGSVTPAGGRELALAYQPAKEQHQILNLETRQALKDMDAPAVAEELKAGEKGETRAFGLGGSAAVDRLARNSLAAGGAKAEAEVPAARPLPAMSLVTTPPAAAAPPTAAYQETLRAPTAALEEKMPALALADSAKAAPGIAAARRRDLSNAATSEDYFAWAGEAKKLAATVHFTQISSEALLKQKTDKAAVQLPVLVNFQVEQSGQDLTLVDADGSVYNGTVQLVQTVSAPAVAPPTVELKASQAEAAPRQSAVGGLWAASQTQAGYSFQVTGTNRSLHQPIVFTGQLIPVGTLQTNLTYGVRLQAGADKLGAQSLPLSGSKIQGVLKIGPQELEINALPRP